MEKELLFKKISDQVVEMEEDEVEALCEESLELGIDPTETINKGLIDGMDRVRLGNIAFYARCGVHRAVL